MSAAISQSARSLIAFCVIAKLLLFAASFNRYGYLSDELYFLDASYRPAFGYVDFPPLIAWVFMGIRLTLGESLWAIRLVATLFGIVSVLLCVDLCRLAGGTVLARWITACIAIFAPGVLSVQGLMTMNVIDQVWWLAGFWLLLRHAETGSGGYLRLLGVVVGLGILTKLSILMFAGGVVIAALVTRRELFANRDAWIAILIAALLSAPFGIWQIANGWPLIDFVSAYGDVEPAAIVLRNPLLGLFITMQPLYAPVWIAGGLGILMTSNPALRFVGVAAWSSLLLLVATGVKFYFAVPVLMLFSACGAAIIGRWLADAGRAAKTILMTVLLVAGLASAPAAIPLLPGETLQRLVDELADAEGGRAFFQPAPIERYFPQFAEMHGWPELVDATARAAASFDADDDWVLVAAHFGEAAALNRLDRDNRLPEAYSGHMNYDLWNREAGFDHGLFVGFDETELREMYAAVTEAGRLDCARCMQREKNLRIYRVARPLLDDDAIRARIRRYDFF